MSYLPLFEQVVEFLEGSVAELEFKRGPAITREKLEQAQQKTGLPMPQSMIDFYFEVGDGLWFRWSSDDESGPGGVFQFHSLDEYVEEAVSSSEYICELIDSNYDFRFTDDPDLARRTIQRMRRWVPFHPEGNGDTFSLDTSLDPAPVVFNQHDWLDGGNGDNGHVMANSLLQFCKEWSRVCFQCPKNLWWPEVLQDGGVNWASDQFSDTFRLPT